MPVSKRYYVVLPVRRKHRYNLSKSYETQSRRLKMVFARGTQRFNTTMTAAFLRDWLKSGRVKSAVLRLPVGFRTFWIVDSEKLGRYVWAVLRKVLSRTYIHWHPWSLLSRRQWHECYKDRSDVIEAGAQQVGSQLNFSWCSVSSWSKLDTSVNLKQVFLWTWRVVITHGR